MGDDLKALTDGLRELTNTVNNLGTKLDDMAVTVKDLSAKVDRLSPLAPVASNLAALPEKVTALQASAYDNTQQVQALNLAVIRVEKAQRDGKAPAEEDSAPDPAANDPPPRGRPKPPPFADRSPPRDYFREEEDDYNDTRFHPRARLEFPTFDGKEDPLPLAQPLAAAKPSSAARTRRSAAASGTRRCTRMAPPNCGSTGWR
jgi:hypothetical protein